MRIESPHHFWDAGRWFLIAFATAGAIAVVLERNGHEPRFSILLAWGINLVVAWKLGRAHAVRGVRRWAVNCAAALGPPLSLFLFFRMWLTIAQA